MDPNPVLDVPFSISSAFTSFEPPLPIGPPSPFPNTSPSPIPSSDTRNQHFNTSLFSPTAMTTAQNPPHPLFRHRSFHQQPFQSQTPSVNSTITRRQLNETDFLPGDVQQDRSHGPQQQGSQASYHTSMALTKHKSFTGYPSSLSAFGERIHSSGYGRNDGCRNGIWSPDGEGGERRRQNFEGRDVFEQDQQTRRYDQEKQQQHIRDDHNPSESYDPVVRSDGRLEPARKLPPLSGSSSGILDGTTTETLSLQEDEGIYYPSVWNRSTQVQQADPSKIKQQQNVFFASIPTKPKSSTLIASSVFANDGRPVEHAERDVMSLNTRDHHAEGREKCHQIMQPKPMWEGPPATGSGFGRLELGRERSTRTGMRSGSEEWRDMKFVAEGRRRGFEEKDTRSPSSSYPDQYLDFPSSVKRNALSCQDEARCIVLSPARHLQAAGMSADTQLVASGRGARGGYDYDVLLLDLSSMKLNLPVKDAHLVPFQTIVHRHLDEIISNIRVTSALKVKALVPFLLAKTCDGLVRSLLAYEKDDARLEIVLVEEGTKELGDILYEQASLMQCHKIYLATSFEKPGLERLVSFVQVTAKICLLVNATDEEGDDFVINIGNALIPLESASPPVLTSSIRSRQSSRSMLDLSGYTTPALTQSSTSPRDAVEAWMNASDSDFDSWQSRNAPSFLDLVGVADGSDQPCMTAALADQRSDDGSEQGPESQIYIETFESIAALESAHGRKPCLDFHLHRSCSSWKEGRCIYLHDEIKLSPSAALAFRRDVFSRPCPRGINCKFDPNMPCPFRHVCPNGPRCQTQFADCPFSNDAFFRVGHKMNYAARLRGETFATLGEPWKYYSARSFVSQKFPTGGSTGYEKPFRPRMPSFSSYEQKRPSRDGPTTIVELGPIKRDPVPADCILLLDCITHLTRKLKQPRVNLSEVAFRILQKKPDFYRSTVFKDLKSLTDAAEKFGMIVKGEEGNGLNWIELVGEGAEDNGVLA